MFSFEKDEIEETILENHHTIVRCDNGMGLSIIHNKKDLWDLAVIKFHGPNRDDYAVDFNNPVCDWPLENLNMKEVLSFITPVKQLNNVRYDPFENIKHFYIQKKLEKK